MIHQIFIAFLTVAGIFSVSSMVASMVIFGLYYCAGSQCTQIITLYGTMGGTIIPIRQENGFGIWMKRNKLRIILTGSFALLFLIITFGY